MKSTLPENEAGRLDMLVRYEILDTPAEGAFDDIAAVAAFVCGTPWAAISFLDSNREWFKAAHGFSPPQVRREGSFGSVTIAGNGLTVIPDAYADPGFSSNALVKNAPKVRFYAGVPLKTPEGFCLGALAAMSPEPMAFPARSREAFLALARQVLSTLHLRQLSSVLTDAMAALKTLQGILSICAYCKNIRDEEGGWLKKEKYLQANTLARFSHGICPDCVKKHVPER